MKQPCKSCQTAITLLPSRTSRSFPAIGMLLRCPSTQIRRYVQRQDGLRGGQDELSNITLQYDTSWQQDVDALETRVKGYKAEKDAAEEPSVNASLRRMPRSGSKV